MNSRQYDPHQSAPPASGPDAWQQALEAAGQLYRATGPLLADRQDTLARLRAGLSDIIQRRRALLLLSYLDADYAIALTDQLVDIAQSQRDALLVRQIFGRLPHDRIEEMVPAAVWRLMGDDEDDDAVYQRMAELLYHLGLTDALRQLCARALTSSNPYTRDVAEEFAPDGDAAEPR